MRLKLASNKPHKQQNGQQMNERTEFKISP